MKRLNVSEKQMREVAGNMVAIRAADSLNINIDQFYYLAKKFSIPTAFVNIRWTDSEIDKAVSLRAAGKTKKEIGKEICRSEQAVKSLFRRLKSNN
ncbi:sigma-70 family RNA polymerase sigma factor [Klebsiella aerogenes]|nr:sigma-70 family RNA polymerase sigma factor [Klebsiella aerogenes]ELA0226272.1 sigma-70 family RNA polymerase sigma factor [Klebsiella aerogenes]